MRLFTHTKRDLSIIYADILHYINSINDLTATNSSEYTPLIEVLEKITDTPEYMTEEDDKILHDYQAEFKKIYDKAQAIDVQNKLALLFSIISFMGPLTKRYEQNLKFVLQTEDIKADQDTNPNILKNVDKLLEVLTEFITHSEVRNVRKEIAAAKIEQAEPVEQPDMNRML